MGVRWALAALTLCVWACDGGDDTDTPETDTDDTETDSETDGEETGFEDDTVWIEAPFIPLDLVLPITVGGNKSFQWFRTAAEFEAWSGLEAPAEWDVTTHALVARVGNPAPFPGTHGTFTKFELAQGGGTRVRVSLEWEQPGEDCGRFYVPMVPATFGLVPTTPRRPRFGIRTENSGPVACTSGAELNDTCSVEEPCGPELMCFGISRADEGVCGPLTALADFALDPAPIPDNDGSYVSTVEVSGLLAADTDVLLAIELNHPNLASLRVTVTNPAGTSVVAYNGEPNGGDKIVNRALRGFPGDEGVNGTWTVTVEDSTAGGEGNVGPSRLEIGSRAD